MRKVFWALASLVMLTSCRVDPSEGGEGEPTPVPTVAAPDAPAIPEQADANDAQRTMGARSVSEETDDFLFEYSYPAEAGDIPELAAMLDRMLSNGREELVRQSAEARQIARDNGFPFNKYSESVTWMVVSETPDYLSLSADIYAYWGGAHGNSGIDALVWDKNAHVAHQPEDFFSSIDELDTVLAGPFCDLLNRERGKRRGEPVPEDSDDSFEACVPLEETTLLLGSSNGRAFNRIGIHAAPYVAGPYVEGPYEFTFPVNDAVIAVVKEDYLDGFASRN